MVDVGAVHVTLSERFPPTTEAICGADDGPAGVAVATTAGLDPAAFVAVTEKE